MPALPDTRLAPDSAQGTVCTGTCVPIESHILAGSHAPWAQVMEAVETVLASVPLNSKLGPQELVQVLGSMLVGVEAALGGAEADWAALLVGTDAETQAASLTQGGFGERPRRGGHLMGPASGWQSWEI